MKKFLLAMLALGILMPADAKRVKEQPLLFHSLRRGGESVDRQAWPHFAAGVAIIPGRRFQKKHFGVLQPGHELLGTGGNGGPGLGGET